MGAIHETTRIDGARDILSRFLLPPATVNFEVCDLYLSPLFLQYLRLFLIEMQDRAVMSAVAGGIQVVDPRLCRVEQRPHHQ